MRGGLKRREYHVRARYQIRANALLKTNWEASVVNRGPDPSGCGAWRRKKNRIENSESEKNRIENLESRIQNQNGREGRGVGVYRGPDPSGCRAWRRGGRVWVAC